MATKIYEDGCAYWADKPDDLRLFHEVWDATPFMVDVYTGKINSDRHMQMMIWCRDQFGPRYWWLCAGSGGAWQDGSATVDDWTWFGFATQELMDRFVAAWPAPADAA